MMDFLRPLNCSEMAVKNVISSPVQNYLTPLAFCTMLGCWKLGKARLFQVKLDSETLKDERKNRDPVPFLQTFIPSRSPYQEDRLLYLLFFVGSTRIMF